MDSRWTEEDAARCDTELALRAYSSRLLGRDPALVLLGGGNTSIKLKDIAGADVLYVKGTGADLAKATARDFTPLRLTPVRKLLRIERMDNTTMMRELAAHITVAGARRPSIETLLHAALPAPYVEHTHADSILAVTNTTGGIGLAEKVFGDIAIVVPYHHSGFALAKACAEAWQARAKPSTIGIVLMHHGAVACGDSARTSYENMLRLVTRAEDYLHGRGAGSAPMASPPPLDETRARDVAMLRRDISRAAGYPLLLTRSEDPVCTAFALRTDLDALALESPATPQHAVFARRLPMLGRDVQAYTVAYSRYLRQIPGAADRLDAAPRIVLDPELGLLAAGITPWHLNAAAIVYRHTIDTILNASAHAHYAGLPPRAVLEAELEYGGIERRIATQRPPSASLAGTVVLLAPSLGAFLKPAASVLLARGAAVLGFGTHADDSDVGSGFLALGDANPACLSQALVKAIGRFGGIDTLACTAGDRELAERVLPWLRLSPATPRVVVVALDGRAHAVRTMLDNAFGEAGIKVTKVNASAFASPMHAAQAVARVVAVRPVYSFPDFN